MNSVIIAGARGSVVLKERCYKQEGREFETRFFSFVIPFYLQSVPVHSANCVKNVYSGI
jgi:hypothetical protein